MLASISRVVDKEEYEIEVFNIFVIFLRTNIVSRNDRTEGDQRMNGDSVKKCLKYRLLFPGIGPTFKYIRILKFSEIQTLLTLNYVCV